MLRKERRNPKKERKPRKPKKERNPGKQRKTKNAKHQAKHLCAKCAPRQQQNQEILHCHWLKQHQHYKETENWGLLNQQNTSPSFASKIQHYQPPAGYVTIIH